MGQMWLNIRDMLNKRFFDVRGSTYSKRRVKEGCLGTIGPKGSSTVYGEGALEGSVAKAEL